MARVKFTGNTQNLRRSGRLLCNSGRKPKKGNENKIIQIDSEDERTIPRTTRTVNLGIPTNSPFFDRLFGNMDREVQTPATQVIPTQLQDPDTICSQIVPFGYCFEDEAHEHDKVDDLDDGSKNQNEAQQDDMVVDQNEGSNEQRTTIEATKNYEKEKDIREEGEKDRREDDSEEDHVVLSEIIKKKYKGKMKILNEPKKIGKGKKKLIGEESRRMITKNTKEKKPVLRAKKTKVVRKKKMTARTETKQKIEREEKYSRGSVLGINREDLYEVAPLILPREKWSSTQKLNIYSRYEVVKNIKEKLSNKHLGRFKRSCFGPLLEIKIQKFPSQLLYHLIRRQCSLTKGDELCFNLEGKVVKFCMKDFQKITGLNCGELPVMDMQKLKGRFLNKYFNSEKPIKRTIVSDLFLTMEGVKKKDKVRLAKLYFLSNFLIGKQVCTGVELEHITLLDDDEQFEMYPWGRIAYNTTIDSIKKAIKNPDAMIVGISGFPQALVVWAYECIPLLSGPSIYIAQKVAAGTPKINNWIGDVHPEWKDLTIKVFEHENFEFVEMADEEDEVFEVVASEKSDARLQASTSKGKDKEVDMLQNNTIIQDLLAFRDVVMNTFAELNTKIEGLVGEVENLKKEMRKDMVNVSVQDMDEGNHEYDDGDNENDGGDGGRGNVEKPDGDNEGGDDNGDEGGSDNEEDDTRRNNERTDEGNMDEELPRLLTEDESVTRKILLEVENIEKAACNKEKRINRKRKGVITTAKETSINDARDHEQNADVKPNLNKRGRRNVQPSMFMRSPFTSKFGSSEDKKAEKKIISEDFNAPSFNILSQL